MKGILLIAGVLALAVSPVRAGVHVSVNIGGGGYHCWGGNYSRNCGYSAGCYRPYNWNRSCGYNYGWGWGGGYAVAYPYYYYPTSYYDNYTSYPPYQSNPYPYYPPLPPQTANPAPPAPPAPVLSQPQEPLGSGVLDVNGFVHSPYSAAIFKVPDVHNGQLVYDPVTGKPFLVR